MRLTNIKCGKQSMVSLLAAGAVLILLGAWILRIFWPTGEELIAVVTVGGEKVMEIPLSEIEGTVQWSLLEEYGVPVHLQAEKGRIRFVDVECPDHICEKSGWLVAQYQSAVCMPNRTVVSVYPASYDHQETLLAAMTAGQEEKDTE